MVVLPILWTISLAFQRIRLINLRSAGLFGDYTLANFAGSIHLHGVLDIIADHARSTRSSGRPRRSGSVSWPRWPCASRSAAATFVRAAMLLPYVAPVVAATFVWSTMLNPQFGIVNYWGHGCWAGTSRSPFLSQATASSVVLRSARSPSRRPCSR